MNMLNQIRTILVDDHTMFLEGVKEVLKDEPRVNVVGTAFSGQQALQLLETVDCDILVTDLTMEEIDGLELTQVIAEKYPDIKILVVTMHDEASQIRTLLDAGAGGYILKNSTRQEFIEAITSVYEKGDFFTNDVKDILLKSLLTKEQDRPLAGTSVNLTKRELEILKLIVEEMTNPEISERLFVSIHTVETHRRNIMRKMEVHNSIGLMKKALQMGLIEN